VSGPGENAQRLHAEALRMDPRANRAWPQGPVGDALWAIATRLNVINREQAFQGTSLLLMDPRDLALMGERLANAAQIQGMLVTAESLGAVSVALWVASLRAAELDPASGDAA
jgi:hypothetical protein